MDLDINGEIADWDVSSIFVKNKLKELTVGEELNITINSLGGQVYEGVAIFNLIREEAMRRAVSVVISGVAASMATYIALAARTVNPQAKLKVASNSVFMIHNPWVCIAGDHHALRHYAGYMEKLATMIRDVYALFGTDKPTVRQKQMDEETYFVGKEIVDTGFASEIEVIQNPEQEGLSVNQRDNLVINAKLAFSAVQDKLKKEARDKDGLSNVAALLNIENNLKHISQTEKPTEEPMTEDELKAKFPALWEQVFNSGLNAGVEKEKKRVLAHIKLGKQAKSLETAAKYIEDGKSVLDEDVHADYWAISMNNTHLDARNADDPPTVKTGEKGTEDAAAALAAFNKGLGGTSYAQ